MVEENTQNLVLHAGGVAPGRLLAAESLSECKQRSAALLSASLGMSPAPNTRPRLLGDNDPRRTHK